MMIGHAHSQYEISALNSAILECIYHSWDNGYQIKSQGLKTDMDKVIPNLCDEQSFQVSQYIF